MKASKVSAALVLLLIVLLTNIRVTYIKAQDNKDENFRHKIYLSAGFEFSSLNNSDGFSKLVDNGGLMFSIAYDYKPQFQFELKYVYDDNIRYYYINETNFTRYSSFSHRLYDRVWSNYFEMKMNYYFSKKLEENPLYLTGGVSAAVQRVKLYESYNFSVFDSLGHFSNYYSFINPESYTRVLIGPEAGVGFFLAFGKINFRSELTFSARFSPFRDTGYKEFAINLTNGLVYKF